MNTQTRAELLRDGLTVRQIAAMVHRGDLVRVRRGHYAPPDAHSPTVRAVRVGGRLTCVSELRVRGIWVLDDERVHVHLKENASRLRDPDDRRSPLHDRSGAVLHWMPLRAPQRAMSSHVGTIDALIHAAACLSPYRFHASLDSAWRQGAVSRSDLLRIAAALPHALRERVARADPSAGSGIETIVRELAIDLGFLVQTQVPVPEVGRVDLLIEKWIAVETDGAEFHDEAVAPRDRRRDAALAAQGITPLRFGYSQVVHDLPSVADALIGSVESHRRVRNSGQIARRARLRLARLNLA